MTYTTAMQCKLVSWIFTLGFATLLSVVLLLGLLQSHVRIQLSLQGLHFHQWSILDSYGTGQQQGTISSKETKTLHETYQITGSHKDTYEDDKVVHKKSKVIEDKKQEDLAVGSKPERLTHSGYRSSAREITAEEVDKEPPGTAVIKGTNSSHVQRVILRADNNSPGKEALLEVPASLPHNFKIRRPFSLPVPFATLPLDQILHTEWLQALKDFLSTLKPDSGLVTIVSSDYKYSEVLLNWLISALVQVDRPLSNVLVLSLDSSLHALLQGKGFACIHVPPEQLLQPAVLQIITLTNHIATHVYILRLTVMRLVNHWGYDIANYDTDAIVLKNPEPLYYEQYRDSDFIGSYGHFPLDIKQEWGIAVCTGAVMIRSSIRTEQYWEGMSKVLPKSTSDQAKLNMALKAMDIKWSTGSNGSRISILKEAWQGKGRGGFTVTVLPSTVMCRARECLRHHRSSYYVWHRGGKHEDGKRKYAAGAGLWYLRTDWMTVSNGTTTKGLQWLKAVATH